MLQINSKQIKIYLLLTYFPSKVLTTSASQYFLSTKIDSHYQKEKVTAKLFFGDDYVNIRDWLEKKCSLPS